MIEYYVVMYVIFHTVDVTFVIGVEERSIVHWIIYELIYNTNMNIFEEALYIVLQNIYHVVQFIEDQAHLYLHKAR